MVLKLLVVFGLALCGSACVKDATALLAAAPNVSAPALGKDAQEDHGAHHDGDVRPFNESRDAMADVDAALERARHGGRNALLILGGNWCHDSRGLAADFERPELSEVIAAGYELVFVDVGYRDRNLDVAARFGVMELYGTPTVLIVSPAGALLNRESVHDWRTAASKPYADTLDYFRRYRGGGQG